MPASNIATPSVTHRDLKGFQAQYGSLWHAVEAYFDNRMRPEQMAALEQVANPLFFAAVAMTRTLAAALDRSIG